MSARLLPPVLALVAALSTGALTEARGGPAARTAEASWFGGAPPATRAFPGRAADADTSLDRFLSGLSDSTDRYFGDTAAPRDTAGLDSALAYGLLHPAAPRARTREKIGVLPEFAFNRVDGPVWGGMLKLGSERGLGGVRGDPAWAAGPNRLLGEAVYTKVWSGRAARWTLRVGGGRATAVMDRTDADHGDENPALATLRALFGGGDRNRYLRHDGVSVGLERGNETWRAGVGYRDMLESPLPVTATWTLVGGGPVVKDNLPAAFGRAREARFEVAWVWPGMPVQTEIQHQTSGHGIGSDFEYRRTRIASAATIALGRHATVVPQAMYGRITGRPVPQASFYLGGASSLRSVEGAALGGTGLALGRIDLIGTDDALALARVPHPVWLPLQLGAFLGSGAVWGADPYGGAGAPGGSWPGHDRWLSEAGLSIVYQPGIPEPTTLLRFDWARPLGPGGRSARFSFGYTRAIDLLHPVR